MKGAALKLVKPPKVKELRYRPPDGLLVFLQGL
jgi:hypothetical protein